MSATVPRLDSASATEPDPDSVNLEQASATVQAARNAPNSLVRSELVARLLDDLIRVPGTSIGVGLDAIVGLVPGIGDGATTVLSSAILIEAVRCRVPLRVLMRMGVNVIFDAALSLVPAVGDLADIAFRANKANVRLLRDCLEQGRTVDTSMPGYLLRAGGVVVATVAIMVATTVASWWLLWQLLSGLT